MDCNENPFFDILKRSGRMTKKIATSDSLVFREGRARSNAQNAYQIANVNPYFLSITVLPVLADSLAASKIFTTMKLFSSEYNPFFGTVIFPRITSAK